MNWREEQLLADPEARERERLAQQQAEAHDAYRTQLNRDLDEAAAKERANHPADWDKWKKKVDDSNGNLAIIELDWFRFDVPGTLERLEAALRNDRGVVHIGAGLTFVVVKRFVNGGTPVTTQSVRQLFMNIVDELRAERPKIVPRERFYSPFREDLEDPRIRAQRSMDASRRAAEGYAVSEAELRGDY